MNKGGSIFVKRETPGGNSLEGKERPSKYSNAVAYSGTDGKADSYGDSMFSPGGDFGGGTIVPKTAPRGGVSGECSNYGKVVQGQTVSGDASLGNLDVKAFNPEFIAGTQNTGAEYEPGEKQVPEAKIEDPVDSDDSDDVDDNEDTPSVVELRTVHTEEVSGGPQEETVKKSPSDMSVHDQEIIRDNADTILDSILDTFDKKNSAEYRGVPPMHSAPPMEFQPQMSAPAQLPKPQSTTKVKFKGTFGTYRGTYRHVYVTSEFVILVYDEDAAVFTPPPSEAEFTLDCGKDTYTVYFMGIEFDLPCIDGGIQVMIRSDE